MSEPQTDPAASALVAACEGAWADIRGHHQELPPVVLVLGSGIQGGRLVKLGHWWQSQWVADGHARGEVLLAGEALHLPAEQVFEILLHEAAHGLNCARGIKDTSREGRYHNQRFKTTATEVGMRVQRMNPYGWAKTSLRPDTVERYAGAITEIGEHLRIARAIPRRAITGVDREGGRDGAEAGGPEGGDAKGPKTPMSSCGCGRKMRMAPGVMAKGPVTCGLCETEFSVPGVERDVGAAAAASPTGDFVERRTGQVSAEGAMPDRMQQGLDLIAAVERAMAVVMARTGDRRPLDVLHKEKPGLVEWYDDVTTAEVVELSDQRGSEGVLDLRTVELPTSEAVRVEIDRAGADIIGPEL